MSFTLRDATHVGEVVAVNEEMGQYTVFCAALGHLREGTAEFEAAVRTTGASTGSFVNYEDATVES